MAGATNGLILCLLSLLTATTTVPSSSAQNSQTEVFVSIPQSPTHMTVLKNTSLFIPCGINTTAEILDSWWLKNGNRIGNSGLIHLTGLDLEFDKLVYEPGRNVSDAGKYRCVVKLRSGVLLGPIRIVSIAALENTACSGSIIEGFSNQNVVLPCCVLSIPSGNVVWTKLNGGEINLRFNQLDNGDLLISNLTEKDSGSYRCSVKNHFYNGAAEVSASVHLSVEEGLTNFGPRILDTFERDLILTTQPSNLICSANGFPVPIVNWIITFESSPNQILTRVIPSNSIILNASNFTGNYTCVANNGVRQVSKSVMVKLPPSFPNPPLLTYPPAKTVRFECRSPLSPIVWYKDGEVLQTNQGRVKHKNDELIISNTILSDSGFYQCESENYIGTGRLSIEPPKEILEAPVSLDCTSTSPTQIVVKWRSSSGKNVQAFSVHYTPLYGGEERQLVTKNTTLLIEALVPNTNYSIYVRSYSGISASGQSQHMFCTTLEDSPIAIPAFLPVPQLGPPSQYRLRWKKLTKEEARGTIQHYKLQWRVNDGSFSKVQILRGDSEEFIITGLLPSTHYSLRLLPATLKGYPVGKDALPWTNFETGNSNATFAPPELEVSIVNATTVVTSWLHEYGSISGEDDDESGFRLHLGQLDDLIEEIIYGPIIYLSRNEREYTFAGLTPGAQYQVSLQAFNETWESSLATKNFITESGVTPNTTNTITIQNLEAKPISSTEISLKWSQPADAGIGTYVVRFKAVESKDISFKYSDNESVIVGNLRPFASYEFDVAFQKNGTCGPFSQKVETVTLEGKPGPPLSPQFQVLNKTSIQVTWQTPTSSNGKISGYLVELTEESTKGASTLNTTETKITLTQLQQNRKYSIRIAAETGAGLGDFSIFLHPQIFNTNNISKTGENGEMIQDRPKSNLTASSSSPGSSDRQLGLILGIVLGLISIIVCSVIIIWRNYCFSFIVNRGRRARTATYMNGGVEKDTVDSPGMEMLNLRTARSSQSFLDTKGGHPTVILSGNATDPLLIRKLRIPDRRAEEFDRETADREEVVPIKD